MKISHYFDINQFKSLVEPFLLQHEAINNLLIGILNKLENDIHTYSNTEKPIFITVSENNEIVLVSIRTPPHNQLLSYTENLESIKFLVDELSKEKSNIPGVLGFKKGALLFAKLWAKKRKQTYTLDMHERIYQLERVNKSTLGSNTFCVAIPNEKKAIFNNQVAFIKEVFPTTSQEEILRSQQRLDSAIEKEKVFVLKRKKKIVSMVQRAGETPNSQTINMVYTPPNERGKGYATELVARVSQKILDEGKKYCYLFTDLSNPTSNKIYQTVGYKSIVDVDVYLFK